MTYARPKTRGELRDLLAAGISCEVATDAAETTSTMLRGWLEFEDYGTFASANKGWTVFLPYCHRPKPRRPVCVCCGCGHRFAFNIDGCPECGSQDVAHESMNQ